MNEFAIARLFCEMLPVSLFHEKVHISVITKRNRETKSSEMVQINKINYKKITPTSPTTLLKPYIFTMFSLFFPDDSDTDEIITHLDPDPQKAYMDKF